MAKGRLVALDERGHTAMEWDVEDPESLVRAEDAIRYKLESGQTMFDTTHQPATRMSGIEGFKGFDPETFPEEVTFVPQLQGG
jgi:hypothetical protein